MLIVILALFLLRPSMRWPEQGAARLHLMLHEAQSQLRWRRHATPFPATVGSPAHSADSTQQKSQVRHSRNWRATAIPPSLL
jgi:hypothetical protein